MKRTDATLVVERALGLVQRDLAGLMVPAGTATPPAGTFSGQFQDRPTDSLNAGIRRYASEPRSLHDLSHGDGWSPFSEVQVVAYFSRRRPTAPIPRTWSAP